MVGRDCSLRDGRSRRSRTAYGLNSLEKGAAHSRWRHPHIAQAVPLSISNRQLIEHGSGFFPMNFIGFFRETRTITR
jgi:hypothetical protein